MVNDPNANIACGSGFGGQVSEADTEVIDAEFLRVYCHGCAPELEDLRSAFQNLTTGSGGFNPQEVN